MLAVSVYVCLPLCENVLSTSLHIAIQTIYSVLEDLPLSLFFFSLVLLLYFYLYTFCHLFWVHKTHHCPSRTKKKEELHKSVFFLSFLYSAFWKCTLVCSTAVLSRVFALAHTQTHRSFRTNQWMCSFHISCTLKLHGNHNIFNKLLQKNVLLIKWSKWFYLALFPKPHLEISQTA